MLAIAALVRAMTAASHPRATTVLVAVTWTGAALSAIAMVQAVATGGDVFGTVVATLALTVTGTVQLWSRRHLEGDPRQRRFLALSSLLAAALVLTAGAESAPLFAVGWIATSAVVIGLLTLGGPTPQTGVALRRTAATFGLADVALLLAVIVLSTRAGAQFADAAALDSGTAALVGTLVAVAAIARAGAAPLHGWLPSTLAAPTPVSALLHAGVVNAGALLLVRFAPLDAVAAPLIVGIAGGLTVAIAGTAMLTRPDIKGRLVQSTAAQMGFMLIACAIGAYALALVHVVGHALYKSSRFLGAGSALAAEHRRASAPSRAADVTVSRRTRAATASIASGAVVAVAIAAGSLSHPGAALLPFIAATVWVGVWQSLGSRSRARGALAVTLTAIAGGYVVLWAALETAYPLTAAAPAPAWLPLATFALALSTAVAVTPLSPRAVRDTAYAAASAWARPPIPAHRARDLAPSAAPLEYRRTPR